MKRQQLLELKKKNLLQENSVLCRKENSKWWFQMEEQRRRKNLKLTKAPIEGASCYDLSCILQENDSGLLRF